MAGNNEISLFPARTNNLHPAPPELAQAKLAVHLLVEMHIGNDYG
jgi:hypothetical protein